MLLFDCECSSQEWSWCFKGKGKSTQIQWNLILFVFQHGIIEVTGENNQVKSFLEKPKPTETVSRLQSPCFYIMDRSCVHLIDVSESWIIHLTIPNLVYFKVFLDRNASEPLQTRDAPGNFIKFLVGEPSVSIFAYHVSKRYDIGNLESYIECCRAHEVLQT